MTRVTVGCEIQQAFCNQKENKIRRNQENERRTILRSVATQRTGGKKVAMMEDYTYVQQGTRYSELYMQHVREQENSPACLEAGPKSPTYHHLGLP